MHVARYGIEIPCRRLQNVHYSVSRVPVNDLWDPSGHSTAEFLFITEIFHSEYSHC